MMWMKKILIIFWLLLRFNKLFFVTDRIKSYKLIESLVYYDGLVNLYKDMGKDFVALFSKYQ